MNVKENRTNVVSERQRDIRKLVKEYASFALRVKELSVYNDTVFSNSLTSAIMGASPYILNDITQGSGDDESTGLRYLLNSVSVKGRIRFDPAASTATLAQVRLIVFIDHKFNGSPYTTVAKLLAAPTNAENSTLAFRDRNWLSRYTVLHDKMYTMTPKANISTTEYSEAWEQFNLYSFLENRGLEVLRADSAGTYPINHAIMVAAIAYPSGVTIKMDYESVVTYRGP